MAKKQRSQHAGQSRDIVNQSDVMAPDYYSKFNCIGPDCENSCCSGWHVELDRKTWKQYRSLNSETLAPRVDKYVVVSADAALRTTSSYAYIEMLPDRNCPFLQTDKLCMIQKELGGDALSVTCASFPRFHNRFAGTTEYGLDVACPEAARLILLSPEPIKLKQLSREHTLSPTDADLISRGFVSSSTSKADDKHDAFRHAFRKLILHILQFRALSLGARMMMLGLLLDQLSQTIKHPHYKGSFELHPILTEFEAFLEDSEMIEAQFAQVPGNLMHKLQVITGFLADFLNLSNARLNQCILASVDGLLGKGLEDVPNGLVQNYIYAYENYYQPYFREHGHVLENYLVNNVVTYMFPFLLGDYIDQYRSMVFDLTIIQIILVGMAGHHRGLNDDLAVQLIQSFARTTAHSKSYLDKLRLALSNNEGATIEDTVWLLKEL